MSLLKDYEKMVADNTINNLVYVKDMLRTYTEGVSISLKERFCKDWAIPIKLTAEPYFSERLAIYNQYSPCIERFAEFIDLVERLGGEPKYFALYNATKDLAIKYLNENEAMTYFKEQEDMSQFPCAKGFPTSSIFKQTFIGKKFISVDIIKGNFTALKFYNSSIVGNCDTYDEFMKMFTDEPYLRQSKYIRQVIFGNVNPKRQVKLESYMMNMLLSDLLRVVPTNSVVYVSSDELVFDADLYTPTMLEDFKKIVDTHRETGITTREEHFTLKFIPEADVYCKVLRTVDGKSTLDLKCMSHTMMPFVIKALCRERFTSSDYVFELDSKTAKWLEPYKISRKGLPKLRKSWEVV